METAARSAGQMIIRTRILHWERTPSHPSYILGGNHQSPQSAIKFNDWLSETFFLVLQIKAQNQDNNIKKNDNNNNYNSSWQIGPRAKFSRAQLFGPNLPDHDNYHDQFESSNL